ncbi:hypothetical protein GOODEAATRI_022591 [Goodea atripinnis]|uniref:Uncharacterized protein n=1 Tax=Goodea atripinnis TaxID=208336 RepID=A0ABV0N3L4_9TELE
MLSSPFLPGKSDKDIDFLICFMHKSCGCSTLLSSTNGCYFLQTCNIFPDRRENHNLRGAKTHKANNTAAKLYSTHGSRGSGGGVRISLFLSFSLYCFLSFLSSSNSLSPSTYWVSCAPALQHSQLKR